VDTTGNIIVDIADGIGMMSKVKKNSMETLLQGGKDRGLTRLEQNVDILD
jgi:hypothetical protein